MKKPENLNVTIHPAAGENLPISPGKLLWEIKDFMNSGTSPLRIAVEAGVRSRELMDWIQLGKEPAPESLARLRAWFMEELANNRGEPETEEPDYVETPTANRIIDVLDYARFAPTVAVIYGGAGIGKSTTLKHYAASRPRTWIVTATEATRTTSAILMTLVQDYKVRGGFAYRVDSLFNEAMNMMRRPDHQSTNSLLLVDEAQHLDTPAYNAIRAFYDKGIGVVYAGNEEVYSRIYGKTRSRLSQIYTRVGMRLHLPNATPEDADAILDAWGITGREERKHAQLVAATAGGLRQLCNLIRYAKLMAGDRHAPITVHMLKEAADACGAFL